MTSEGVEVLLPSLPETKSLQLSLNLTLMTSHRPASFAEIDVWSQPCAATSCRCGDLFPESLPERKRPNVPDVLRRGHDERVATQRYVQVC